MRSTALSLTHSTSFVNRVHRKIKNIVQNYFHGRQGNEIQSRQPFYWVVLTLYVSTASLTARRCYFLFFFKRHTTLKSRHTYILIVKKFTRKNQTGSAATVSESPQSLLSLKGIGKPLANRDFRKKKLNTNQDTHCIKIGVQLWCG